MKNLHLFIFLSISSFSCFAQTDSVTTETFTKEQYTIQFPKNWKLNESGVMGTDCFISSPLVSDTDSFSENINIIRVPLQVGQLEARDEGVEQTIKAMAKLMTNFKLLSQDRMSINDHETDVLTYTFTQGVLELKIEQRFILANNQMYILTATESAVNPDFIEQLSDILDSFQLVAED